MPLVPLSPKAREAWLKKTTATFFELCYNTVSSNEITGLKDLDSKELYHMTEGGDLELRKILETIHAKYGHVELVDCGSDAAGNYDILCSKSLFDTVALIRVAPAIMEKAKNAVELTQWNPKMKLSLDHENWVELDFEGEEKDGWIEI